MLSNNLFECIDLIILDDEFEANAREWDAKEAYRRALLTMCGRPRRHRQQRCPSDEDLVDEHRRLTVRACLNRSCPILRWLDFENCIRSLPRFGTAAEPRQNRGRHKVEHNNCDLHVCTRNLKVALRTVGAGMPKQLSACLPAGVDMGANLL
jgi:hypothetical protein